jgi:outer membrane receptor protein involved in Fe transport
MGGYVPGKGRIGFHLTSGAILLASTCLGWSAPANAQEAAQPAPVNSDVIIVTAQKREENLQNVPVSIQAIGTEKLDQLQVQAFNDYVKFLPSVSSQSFAPGASLVYMRGVASGGDGNHSGSLPSVGTYLDEQPITTIQGNLDIHLYDIARVEALAGPQGTLYGASSEAGTIRIITNKPDPAAFEGAMDFEINKIDHGDFGGVAEGFVNVPVSENAAVRAVAWYDRDGGYIDNVHVVRVFPTSGLADDNADLVEDNFNDVETYGARVALGIDLDENWTVTPAIMGQKQKSHGSFAFDPDLRELNVARNRDEFSNDRWFQAALTIEGRIGNFDLVYAGSYLKRAINSLTDYADYAYFYDALFGYGAYFYDDNGDLVNPSQYFAGRDRFTKQSHELRLSTPQDKRIRFIGGLFYQRQKHDIQQRYQVDDIGTAIEVPGWPDTIWLTKQDRIDRDYAAFGELAFDLTERLTLTGGLRFFKYDNTLIGFFGYGPGYSSSTGVAACIGPATTEGAPCTDLGVLRSDGTVGPRRAKDDGHIHRLNLTWQMTDDHMVYATWSRGFRPGGTNRRGGLFPYLADFLTNYEVGWKTSWADNRLTWNGAVFREDWEDFQFSILGPNGLTEIRNAAQARIRGVETDINWRITDAFRLSGGATYIDSKLTDNYCGFTDAEGNPVTECAAPEAPTGTRLPVTPKFKGNMTARYDFPIGSHDAHVQASVIHQSSAFSDLRLVEREILGKQKGFTTADLSAGIVFGDWRAEAYIVNVFDERGDLLHFTQCAEAVCGGKVYVVPTQPRTFGLKVGRKF